MRIKNAVKLTLLNVRHSTGLLKLRMQLCFRAVGKKQKHMMQIIGIYMKCFIYAGTSRIKGNWPCHSFVNKQCIMSDCKLTYHG